MPTEMTITHNSAYPILAFIDDMNERGTCNWVLMNFVAAEPLFRVVGYCKFNGLE